MALDGTYTGLQASVADFLNRSDLAASIPDFIVLAEANLNRLLNTREMWAFQTITIASETAPVPGDCQAIESIRINDNCVRKLDYRTPQQMDEKPIGQCGPPREYTVAGGQLVFYPIPASAMQAAPRVRDPNAAVVRITHMGDDRVFTGETPRYRRPEFDDGAHWFPKHKKGDLVTLPRSVAEALQEKGYAEIQD